MELRINRGPPVLHILSIELSSFSYGQIIHDGEGIMGPKDHRAQNTKQFKLQWNKMFPSEAFKTVGNSPSQCFKHYQKVL